MENSRRQDGQRSPSRAPASPVQPSAPRPHRRNRPFLGGTVDADTRLLALGWVALAPPNRRRSVGQWIDRLVERAAGYDREHLARDEARRRRVDAAVRRIVAEVNCLRFGCDAPRRVQALAEIIAAAREIERASSSPSRPPAPGAIEPDYQI